MNTLPRANIHATFTQNTFTLVYMDKLLRFHRAGKIIYVNLNESILVSVWHHRRVGVSAGHSTTLCAYLGKSLVTANTMFPVLKRGGSVACWGTSARHCISMGLTPKTRFVFAVDLDGVCANYIDSLRPYMAATGRTDAFTLPEPTNFNLAEAGWFKDAEDYYATHHYAVERSLFKTMTEIPGMSDGLWTLSDAEIHIRIVTHRILTHGDQDTAVVDTIAWLQHKRQDGRVRVPYRDVCFLGAKSDATANLHIDDAPGQINALKEAGENVLIFDQPYNRHLEGPRAHNWSEVVEMVFEAQDKWTSEESN